MTAAFVDSDGDGLPNDWETANGFNPSIASDATLDSDGDGETNREEFVAGTNPRNGASALRIISFTRAGADLAISWPSVFANVTTCSIAPDSRGERGACCRADSSARGAS
jgi:hypothetical protein